MLRQGRNVLYQSARNRYGNLSVVELEQKVAEAFAQYVAEKERSITMEVTAPMSVSESVYRQELEHLRQMGMTVHNRKEMEAFFREHPEIALLSADEVDEDLLRLFGPLDNINVNRFTSHSMQYGVRKSNVGYSIYHGNYYTFVVDKDGMHRPIIKYPGTEEVRQLLETSFENGPANSKEIIRRVVSAWDNQSGNSVNNRHDTGNRREYVDNDTRNRGSRGQRGKDGVGRGSKEGFNHQEEVGDVEYLRTSRGEIYGFAYQGELYIDETKLRADTPLHEYTHLWDEAVAKIDPSLWKRGVELMRDTHLWITVMESEAYGKRWQRQGKSASVPSTACVGLMFQVSRM